LHEQLVSFNPTARRLVLSLDRRKNRYFLRSLPDRSENLFGVIQGRAREPASIIRLMPNNCLTGVGMKLDVEKLGDGSPEIVDFGD
jgi:hypothetical protein